ncbi:unnamed protein product [Sphagnum jensenii]|uniref:Uncharacterized protein n=1 Tax=Sphagnum jensenii TaxID=128206 RepID=A0ABP0VEZ3_9BRYO
MVCLMNQVRFQFPNKLVQVRPKPSSTSQSVQVTLSGSQNQRDQKGDTKPVQVIRLVSIPSNSGGQSSAGKTVSISRVRSTTLKSRWSEDTGVHDESWKWGFQLYSVLRKREPAVGIHHQLTQDKTMLTPKSIRFSPEDRKRKGRHH